MDDRFKSKKNPAQNNERLKKQIRELKVQYEKDLKELRQVEKIKNIEHNLAKAIVKTDSLKELYETAKKELNTIIDAGNFEIALYDEKTGELGNLFNNDKKITPHGTRYMKQSLISHVMKRKAPLLINKKESLDLAESGNIDHDDAPAECWLGVPLQTNEKIIGILIVQSYDNPLAYDVKSIEILEVIANQLTLYIEIKKAQETLTDYKKRYLNLLNYAFDGIYILNDKRFEFVNDRFCEITQYEKEELLSESFYIDELLTKKGQLLTGKHCNDRLKNEKTPHISEFQIFTKFGSIKDVQSKSISLNIDNQPRTIGFMQDITELNRVRTLEQEIAIAHRSVEFKQNFLTNISHEIRTPLLGVLGIAEILGKTNLSSQQKSYLNTLVQSGENLREIMDLILDYSKIEAGRVRLKKNKFSLKKLISDTHNLFSPLTKKKGIRFKTSVSRQIPDLIISDRQRVNQVLNNLVSNAVKFTEKGKILIKANLINSGKMFGKPVKTNSHLLIKIEVEDTGKGISDKEKKHLFEPFSKSEKICGHNIEGTGLGLAICKELTTLLGGNIGFESKLSKGSKFWFTFKARKFVSDNKLSIKKKKFENIRLNKTLNILFAEDKKVTRKVVTLILSSMGHHVETAGNGKEALKLFKPGKYDLILMDIEMPVMDGITATKMLKEKYSVLPPIVGLSANAFEGDREKYMDQGMDEYLTKPVQEKDFIRIMEKFKIL